VTRRESSAWSSTFPAEVVTSVTADGESSRLWCKYAGVLPLAGIAADRRLEYEARVYREILPRSPVPSPRYRGFYRHATEGWAVLVLEYVENSLQLSKRPESMPAAASWLGRFHAWAERTAPPSWLRRYDRDYYDERIRRCEELSQPWHDRHPWLATVGEHVLEHIDALLSSPDVVVHGEFYPGNVLVRLGDTLPIDWESAAVGSGEFDLAALTEAWGQPVVEGCTRAYVDARWNGMAPPGFDRVLHAARVLWYVRWLAEGRYWKPTPSYERRVRLRIEGLHALLRR
jgi:aminoglycoside phosphotransferase (APT) family kinase protein